MNNNRFSGFIDDAFISFKLTNGPQLEIRREKVLKIVFRQRPQETTGMKWRQFMQLKNGDYFHGQILTKDITISTTYAKNTARLRHNRVYNAHRGRQSAHHS